VTLVGVRAQRHLLDALAFEKRPALSETETMQLASVGLGYTEMAPRLCAGSVHP
jgi:hypothetical protein